MKKSLVALLLGAFISIPFGCVEKEVIKQPTFAEKYTEAVSNTFSQFSEFIKTKNISFRHAENAYLIGLDFIQSFPKEERERN